MTNSVGLLVCLTGPSGSGKTSIILKLMELFPNLYTEAVSTSTRPKREGEVDGVSYKFVSPEQFQEIEDEGELIESITYNGNRYGIQKSEIQKYISIGKVPVLTVEPNGLIQVMKNHQGMIFKIHLVAPKQVLFDRMISRGDNSEDAKKRSEHDDHYFKSFDINYDLVIQNDEEMDLTHCALDLHKQICELLDR